jgi:hypothetical protein
MLLTCWSPTDELIHLWKEGGRYAVYNLQPSLHIPGVYRIQHHITTTRSTRWLPLPDVTVHPTSYQPRTYTPCNSISYPSGLVDVCCVLLDAWESMAIVADASCTQPLLLTNTNLNATVGSVVWLHNIAVSPYDRKVDMQVLQWIDISQIFLTHKKPPSHLMEWKTTNAYENIVEQVVRFKRQIYR